MSIDELQQAADTLTANGARVVVQTPDQVIFWVSCLLILREDLVMTWALDDSRPYIFEPAAIIVGDGTMTLSGGFAGTTDVVLDDQHDAGSLKPLIEAQQQAGIAAPDRIQMWRDAENEQVAA